MKFPGFQLNYLKGFKVISEENFLNKYLEGLFANRGRISGKTFQEISEGVSTAIVGWIFLRFFEKRTENVCRFFCKKQFQKKSVEIFPNNYLEELLKEYQNEFLEKSIHAWKSFWINQKSLKEFLKKKSIPSIN